MASSKKTFSVLGLLFGPGCLTSLIASFASDRWVVSTETQVAGFKNLGLWAACFSKFRPPTWVLNKYYDGCWWLLDREMDEIRFYLVPPWFVATQTLVTLSLVFQLIAIIIMIVNTINCFPYSRSKDTIALALSAAAAVLHGLTGIFLAVAVILFGVRADNSRTWLERPDQNYLSWSFGLCVLAAFLAILAFMAVSLETYRLWWVRKNNEKPGEMYTSDLKEFPQSYSKYSNQRGQDKVYSMQESQAALMRKPAFDRDSYHQSDVGENRQRGRTNGYIPQNERRPASGHTLQETRLLSSRDRVDAINSQMLNTTSRSQSSNTTSRSQSSSDCRKTQTELNTDYEESKKMEHPVLPEYIPKSKTDISKTRDKDSTLEESDSDSDSDEDNVSQSVRTKPDIKSRKSNRADSKKQTNQLLKGESKRRSDTGRSKHKDKYKNKKENTSDDERSRSRSKKHSSSARRHNSQSRERSSSRHRSSSHHRSHSRDLNSAGTESCSDSDSTSAKSQLRGRQTRKQDASKKSRKRRPSFETQIKEEKHKHSISSTSSSKIKTHKRSTDDLTGSLYVRKQQTKRTGDRNKSVGQRRSKSQDCLDTESLHSHQGRSKARSSYSSYYEY